MTFGLTNDTHRSDERPRDARRRPERATPTRRPRGSAIYFNGNNAGSLTISDPFTDAQSAPFSVNYPALARTAGHTRTRRVTTSPELHLRHVHVERRPRRRRRSTLTETDAGGNTRRNAVTLTNDTTAPTGGAISVPATSSYAERHHDHDDELHGRRLGDRRATSSLAPTRRRPRSPASPARRAATAASTVVTSPDTVPTRRHVLRLHAHGHRQRRQHRLGYVEPDPRRHVRPRSVLGERARRRRRSRGRTRFRTSRCACSSSASRRSTTNNRCQASGVTYGAPDLDADQLVDHGDRRQLRLLEPLVPDRPRRSARNTITVTYQDAVDQRRGRRGQPLEHQAGRARRVQRRLRTRPGRRRRASRRSPPTRR